MYKIELDLNNFWAVRVWYVLEAIHNKRSPDQVIWTQLGKLLSFLLVDSGYIVTEMPRYTSVPVAGTLSKSGLELFERLTEALAPSMRQIPTEKYKVVSEDV